MIFIIYYSYMDTDSIFNVTAEGYENLDYMIKYVENNLNAKIEYIRIKKGAC